MEKKIIELSELLREPFKKMCDLTGFASDEMKKQAVIGILEEFDNGTNRTIDKNNIKSVTFNGKDIMEIDNDDFWDILVSVMKTL